MSARRFVQLRVAVGGTDHRPVVGHHPGFLCVCARLSLAVVLKRSVQAFSFFTKRLFILRKNGTLNAQRM